MSLRVVVADDEEPARDELCFLLEQAGGIEIVSRVENGLEAMSAVERLAPDLVFLDVQMPGLSGFEVAQRLVERQSPTHIIFVTAFDRYAIEAFEVNAVDYLLKPVESTRLESAVTRARQRVSSERPHDDRLERIMHLLAERQSRQEQLAVKVGDRFLLVHADDIIYASLADESINIVTGQLAGTSNYRTLD